jgi:hypothetical protein
MYVAFRSATSDAEPLNIYFQKVLIVHQDAGL